MMSRTSIAFAAVSCFIVTAGGALAAGTSLKIDPAKSTVYAVMLKASPTQGSTAVSHDHVFRARDVSGLLTWDAAAPEKSSIKLTVKTPTIAVDETTSRKRMGLEGELSESENLTLEKELKGNEGLDVAKNPLITFTSSSFAKRDDGRWLVTGDLVMHGVTRTVELPVSVTVAPNGVTMDGRLVVKQTQFDLKPCNKFLGAVKCADEVTFLVHLVARP